MKSTKVWGYCATKMKGEFDKANELDMVARAKLVKKTFNCVINRFTLPNEEE